MISVSKTLPSETRSVMVLRADGFEEEAYLFEGGFVRDTDGEPLESPATHWSYLPTVKK
jgi:hypothetical protein